MRIFILIFVVLLSKGLQAQDITTTTLSWSVSRTQVINTGDISESDKVVSHSKNTVEWKDSRGVMKKSFAVSDVRGSWSNVQSQGSIIYDVQCDGKPGTITFQRTASGTMIRILLLNGEAMPDIYEMTVSTITVQ